MATSEETAPLSEQPLSKPTPAEDRNLMGDSSHKHVAEAAVSPAPEESGTPVAAATPIAASPVATVTTPPVATPSPAAQLARNEAIDRVTTETQADSNANADNKANNAPTDPAVVDMSITKWLRLLVRVTTCLALVMALAVAVRLLGFIAHTLLLFSLGALVAYALDPLVNKVRSFGGKERPRWVGVAVVFVVLIGLSALGTVLLGKTLVHQVQVLVRDQNVIKDRALAVLGNIDQWATAHDIPVNTKDYVNNPPPAVKARVQEFAGNAVKMAERFSASLVESVLVVLIALYFLIYSKEMREGMHNSLPAPVQPYAEQWQNDVNRILGGFVRGQLILALVMGAAAALGCAVLQVPFWLVIGIFVVFASLIPVVGPYLGAIPAIIAAAIAPPGFVSPGMRVVLVIVLFVVINEAGSKILYPRLVGAALGLHEVLVLFVLLAGFEVGHLWGVLFAAPLTALAIVTATQLYRLWQGLPAVSVAQAAKTGGREAKAAGTP
ncbi:MAG: AI-2E family transporter [Abitibacteriaceae bacterium]|nr:AI-2E family transporter [Abditibacteriaceae bacterium]MBV9864890.1 AI-2E family transporter [Abditibacteriaceae bacterium]